MKKNKVRILTLVVVFLLGVVAAVVSCLPSIKENLMLSAVLLSVGCSLLATAISTFVLLMSDNSLEETVQSSLRAVGIDVDLYKRHNQAKPISSRQDYSKLKKSTEKAIRKFQIKGPLSVGHFARTTLSNYYDLIGATCSSINAKHFASILSTFWQQSIASVDEVHHPAFDFVVTPKGGSPMLGYEFAESAKKPFLLHEQSERLHDKEDDMRTWFDCAQVPPKGQTALIVDDSTTGGTMVIETAEHLRQYGYQVHTCLVIFTPMNSGAQDKLKSMDIQLVSAIKTHNNKQTDRDTCELS